MARLLTLLLALGLSGCLLQDIDESDWDADGTADDQDCDPTDPGLNDRDADGDGSTTCGGDCDDADPAVESLDADGDGVDTCGGDCDDADATVAPGRIEVCDGLDNNCDGSLPADEVDEDGDGAPLCFDCDDDDPSVDGLDEDGDGFGPCSEEPDCDEDNDLAYPGAPDLWGDGVDQSCDGVDGIDEDGDGHASNADVGSDQFDCDDNNPDIHDSADEVCDGLDTDCDGDLPAGEGDEDGDGWLACDPYVDNGGGFEGGGDCHDDVPAAWPGLLDTTCDGLDTDCDGMITTGDEDLDGDGYVGCADFVDQGVGLLGGDDCDDDSAVSYPGAPEICDGLDNDCDTALDFMEEDGDADGYVPCGWWQGTDPSIVGDGDCDDSQPEVNPGAPVELCDGLNTDCTGALDVSEMDQDVDSYLPCTPYVDHGAGLAGGGDCDDWEDDVNPGTPEDGCDGVDTNCDGATLAAGEADLDGDGWLACSGYQDHGGALSGGDDCDDGQLGVYPGAPESCDGLDTACSGASLDPIELDSDGDGWIACSPYVDHGAGLSGGGDCSEAFPEINPGAVEQCDGLDTNCDTVIEADESDGDGDGYLYCEGYIDRGGPYTGGGDCDDTNAFVHPDMVEQPCDGLDNDCNVIMFENEDDEDGDGWLACSPYVEHGGGFDGDGDCDDDDPAVHPGTGWDDPSDALDSDCGAGTVTWLGRAHMTLTGPDEADWAGWSVAGVGNVDGDSLADVVVTGIDGGGDPGKVWLVLGSTLAAGGTLSLNSADTRITGASNGDATGSAVVSMADLDGDGRDDLVIGADGASGGGEVYIFFSSTLLASPDQTTGDADVVILAESGQDQFGYSLAAGGDVTGDGVDDLLVGAPGYDGTVMGVGAAYLFSGATLTTGEEIEAEIVLTGFVVDGEVGSALAIFPDVNGDGLDEIVVGAPNVGNGTVYFVHGGPTGSSSVGAVAAHILFGSPGDRAGYGLVVGDFLDDGLPDLAIGAPDSGGWGQVYIFGRDNLVSELNNPMSQADATLSGESVGDWFGASLGAGDVDGDGDDDLLIGAPTTDVGGTMSGGVWLFTAPISTLSLPVAVFAGAVPGDEAGTSVTFAGDVDGDGSDDLLIGAPISAVSADDSGQAHLVLSEL